MGSIGDAIGLLGGMGNVINDTALSQQWSKYYYTTGSTAATSIIYDWFAPQQPAAPTPAKRSKKKPASGSALEWLDQRVNEIRVAL